MAHAMHGGGGSLMNGTYTKESANGAINTLAENYQNIATDIETELKELARKIGGVLTGPAGKAFNSKITKYLNETYRASSGLVNGITAVIGAVMANKLTFDKTVADELGGDSSELEEAIGRFKAMADGSEITVTEKTLEEIRPEDYTNCEVLGLADKENFVQTVIETVDNFITKINNVIEQQKETFNGMDIFGDEDENLAAKDTIGAGLTTLGAILTNLEAVKKEGEVIAQEYIAAKQSNIDMMAEQKAAFSDTSKWISE